MSSLIGMLLDGQEVESVLISDLGYPEELASPFDVRLDADSETRFIAYG